MFPEETQTAPTGGAQAVAETPSPATAASPASPEQQAAQPIGQDTSSAVAAPTPTTPVAVPAPPPSPGWREQLGQYGIDLSPYQDDRLALQYVAQQARQASQANQSVDLARQQAILQLQAQPEFQDYVRFRQQQQAQQQKQGDPWYSRWINPPEYDPTWETQIERLEDGTLRAKSGADPTIPQKWMAYQTFKQQTANKFLSNPLEYIREPVMAIAHAVAQQAIQQQMDTLQVQTHADQFIRDNSHWLHETDPATKTVVREMHPDGVQRPKLSDAGRRFAQYAEEAARAGRNVNEQEQYALQMLNRDHLAARVQELEKQLGQQPATVQATQAAANNAFLARNNPVSHAPAARAVPAVNGATIEHHLGQIAASNPDWWKN